MIFYWPFGTYSTPFEMKYFHPGGHYSPTNPFIIGGPISVDFQSLSLSMAKMTISATFKPLIKPVLIIGEDESQQILEISSMTQIEWVYKPEELADIEKRKRKGKDTLMTKAPIKKMVSKDDVVEL